MAVRPLIVVLPLALGLGLAACDSRDYEAELAELQSQLGEATSELETLRGENESLSGEMAELRTQAEEAAAAAGNLGEEVAERVRGELESAFGKAAQTADRLAALGRDPEAPAEARTEAVGVLRNEVQDIAEFGAGGRRRARPRAAGRPGAGGRRGRAAGPAGAAGRGRGRS